MTNRIQPVGVTIDKLTLLSDLKVHHDDFYKRLESLGFVLQDYQSKKYGYSFVYHHNENGGLIEIAKQKIDYDVQYLERQKFKIWGAIMDIQKGGLNRTGMTLQELNEKLESIQEILNQVDERGHLRRLKDIRYELNPKYFAYFSSAAEAFREVVSMLDIKTLSISGIHIAMDYNVKINDLRITDLKSRKENIFKGEDKSIETIYIGKRSSRNHVVIYDKKKENEDNDTIDQYPEFKDITRFEARLKNDYARKFLTSDFNPFEGINVEIGSWKFGNGDLTINEEAMLFYLLHFPEKLNNLPERTRKRWRKKLSQMVETSINPADDYRNKKSSLVKELENLLLLSETSISEKA